MMRMKEERRALVLLALAAAALLLFFSRCSPLYPTNNWGEANAFFTMGRSMLAGKIPYKDLVMGAGPAVYALHALAALISPSGFLGIWLLEIIALTMLLYFAWKAALRISGMGWLSMGAAVLLGLLLVSGKAFLYGDTVEEWVLPLQMFALCDLLAYLGDPFRSMSTRRLALHGFLAGCVFWTKFELMGVHLAFIAVIAIDDMVWQRELKGAICMCLEYAAGALLATVPWVVWFGVNDALITLLRGYLGGEWLSLLESMRPLHAALAGLVSGAIKNPAAALALLCGAGYLLYRLAHRRWNGACTAVIAAFACTVLIMYVQGERYRFSPLCIGVFLMLCAGPIALLVKHAWRKRRAYAALLGCAAVLCAGGSCLMNDNLPCIGYSREELPQQIFAEYIEENGGGSILTYDIADCGFYLAMDQIPEFRVYADSGSYHSAAMDRQYKLADRNEPEWIISRSKYAPDGLYIEVLQAESAYDRNINSGKIHQYHLYRRIEK